MEDGYCCVLWMIWKKNCDVVILGIIWMGMMLWSNQRILCISYLTNMLMCLDETSDFNCWLPPPAVADASIDERDGFRNGVEKVKSISDKHIDLLRPSARYYATSKGTLLIQTWFYGSLYIYIYIYIYVNEQNVNITTYHVNLNGLLVYVMHHVSL